MAVAEYLRPSSMRFGAIYRATVVFGFKNVDARRVKHNYIDFGRPSVVFGNIAVEEKLFLAGQVAKVLINQIFAVQAGVFQHGSVRVFGQSIIFRFFVNVFPIEIKRNLNNNQDAHNRKKRQQQTSERLL